MERAERLWPDGPRYWYDEQCFPPSTDSFLLGGFASLRRGEKVCDLGAGAGLLGLLLLAREPSLQVTGIERDAHACAVLAHNHPKGIAVPSSADLDVTRQIESALELIGVPLLEHLIITEFSEAPILRPRRGMTRLSPTSGKVDAAFYRFFYGVPEEEGEQKP